MTYPLYKHPRLYLNEEFSEGAVLPLSDAQGHYLKNVLRLTAGRRVRIFNGKDGEWLAEIAFLDKKRSSVALLEIIKPQPVNGWRVRLLFSPIKKQRMDVLIEKAVELGVTDFYPVLTTRTENRSLKDERIALQIIEAAEQCERLDLPVLHPALSLAGLLNTWEGPRVLACLERAEASALPKIRLEKDCAFLIGPEGGFDPEEIESLSASAKIQAVSLGETILRAETAALFCLSHARLQFLSEES
ncbi:MAG: 16S rRNA (uracil(1498)-N(3))-methyltransferase [Alphaproteobacteria bacterium]|nr:16S rRNA (uracil(1498)-N(3))-methyltransferase [Alphaproteobacteria bacterium]